jgi:hypothetical protein
MAAISWRALAGDVVTKRFWSASKSSRPLVLTTSSPSNTTPSGTWETAAAAMSRNPSVRLLRCRDQIRAVPPVRITTARLVE